MIPTKTLAHLKHEKLWIVWRCETRDGRKTKLPINPHNGQCAKTNDPNTWGTHDEARKAISRYNADGLGIILAQGLCGIDIDAIGHGTEAEKINPLAEEVRIMFGDTYAEHSPSGQGVHILGLCDTDRLSFLAKKGDKLVVDKDTYCKNPYNNIEMYISGVTNRFFTFTENALGPKVFGDITDKLNAFARKYMSRDESPKNAAAPKPKATPKVSSEEQGAKVEAVIAEIEKSSSGPKFKALFYDGDLSAYNNDHSAADMALCGILAQKTGNNKDLIRQIFLKSKLFRAKTNREDYLRRTIDKACDSYSSSSKSGTITKERKPALTIEALSDWLEKNKIKLRYNVISHAPVIEGMDPIYSLNALLEQMHIIIHNDIKSVYHCTKSDVSDILSVIVQKTSNVYNPVTEMLSRVPAWDGVDRIAELYAIMRIEDSDELSKTLILSWLYQTCAMGHNPDVNPFGAEGILILKGPQGIGKTTLCRALAGDDTLVKTGLHLDVRNKDTLIRATSCWIGELGEVEMTLRSNPEWLKAFITAETDRYRVPYGKCDVNYPRRTSFIATCNSDEFLVDETGSRRFWVIPLKVNFDLDRLKKFDVKQLWRQVEFEIAETGKSYEECFRLSKATLTELQERNCRFNAKMRTSFLMHKKIQTNTDGNGQPPRVLKRRTTR